MSEDLYGLTEAQTRKLIDQQLAERGWSVDLGNVLEELLIPATSAATNQLPAPYSTSNFVDYTLLAPDGKPIGLVEAKRTSRDAVAGKEQAANYADRLHDRYGFDPFIFLTNGQKIYFWDRSQYPPRPVAGFFTPDDLGRLHFQRLYREPLNGFAPNGRVVERPYQFEAIKRVTEAIERGQRKFLLVMATGTGKTRTVIALVDLLMRAKRIQNVLFLADRRELVRQALGDFMEHMPNETRARIEGGETGQGARIHVATYPSMMQVYEQLSPGRYDLIIADESHRSIYNRYRALFEHFDALQLGLTATPTDYIDHNTFELFECPDGLPTFYYPYETAVQEEYLARYRVLDTQTAFQVQGIKAGELPPELQQRLEEQGIELSEIDFEGSDLEHRVVNEGTTQAMVMEIMEKCRKDASGALPAKTIVFAVSHAHAVRLWETFNKLYPDLQRRDMAVIIDSHMEQAEQTLDKFKRESMPRIAISVDMLDTGIDVPAVQTLVFAKPVFSQVKFWQMIGRGTRRWTNPETGELKTDFLIIDFWNNFAYFNMNPEGEIAKPTEPLPVRLFRLRLEKLALLRGLHDDNHAAQTVAQLQQMLGSVPTGNINVRNRLEELAPLRTAAGWAKIDEAQQKHLATQIAPLLRFMPDVNLPVMTFEARTEQLALAHLAGDAAKVADLLDQVIEDAALLPMSLHAVQQQAETLAQVRTPAFWEHLDYTRIMDVQVKLAPLMRYRATRKPELLTLNLPDEIARRRWIIYGPSGEGAFADTYRAQVEEAIKALANEHPTLAKLRRGEPITPQDEEALAQAVNRPDLYISERVLRDVYDQPDAKLVDFARHILSLGSQADRQDQITRAFDQFIAEHAHFSATQLNFLRALRSVMLRQSRLSELDLQRPPLNYKGDPHRLFSEPELREIMEFANRLAA